MERLFSDLNRPAGGNRSRIRRPAAQTASKACDWAVGSLEPEQQRSPDVHDSRRSHTDGGQLVAPPQEETRGPAIQPVLGRIHPR